jgi:pantoate--beta-alanine ligase
MIYSVVHPIQNPSRSVKIIMLRTFRDIAGLRAAVNSWRNLGQKVALVPTMGALHAGHLDLITLARQKADKVIASLFVNPTQFAPHEDLARYPRNEERDCELLASAGCDLLYAPDANVMYPEGFATSILVQDVSSRWEGEFRPHFFQGVATVVTKLLIQAKPDFAVFGEKDWQQLQVVSKLVADLDIDVAVIGAPTRREADGLAMSSRNAYLTPQQREIAPALKQALDQIARCASAGGLDLETHVEAAKAQLIDAGFTSIDYLAPCNAKTLEPWAQGDPLRVLGAAWLDKTRLIDNRGA